MYSFLTISSAKWFRTHSVALKYVYDYMLSGRSPVEWIMECYRKKTDKDSGLIDDPNDYGDEKYIFELLISAIYVSVKTIELIDSLPEYKEI